MPNYSKLTPLSFKKKIKNGEYKNLTGARRALGKVKDWSEADNAAMQKFATRHFGAAPSPAPVKKAAKKAVKKAVKKTEEAAPVVSAEASKGGFTRVKKPVATKGVAKRGPAKKATSRVPASDATLERTINNSREAVGVYATAIESLRKCEQQGVSIEGQLSKAVAGLEAVIESLQEALVKAFGTEAGQEGSAAEARGAELFQRAAPAAVTPGNGAPAVLMSHPPVPPPPQG